MSSSNCINNNDGKLFLTYGTVLYLRQCAVLGIHRFWASEYKFVRKFKDIRILLTTEFTVI
jgi:hypothetical protein